MENLYLNESILFYWKQLNNIVTNKMRKLSLQAISPFVIMSPKVFNCRCVKYHLQMGKGLTPFWNKFSIFSVPSRQYCTASLDFPPPKVIFNPFPHTAILQQTTLSVFCQNIENLHNWKDNLWQKAENIVAKVEIACFVQFLLLSLCFQKAVCCRGVRKYLYEEKG